ncbi:MAG TPA: sensor domain-containing diguanylate cyclase [Longimicrobiales bacterium]|nr:sensor domain-containing diguanylate cyclase [Longimicrobiales bacterium]
MEATPGSESRRMEALRALDLLGTAPDQRFDRLARLARRLFDVPVALVTLVDSDRDWVKAASGNGGHVEIQRERSLCAHAILDGGITVVPDAKQDERFRDNPHVQGDPEIRFYAGCPVKGPDGSALGALCVIDHRPREIGPDDVEALRDLAELVEHEIKSMALATIDDLTGLTNRRGFEAIAFHTLAVCRRVERPATLLLFDLNDFKLVNDSLGHLEGDRVLRTFADSLRASFRDSDVVARLGGDEFCVLLSGATAHDMPRPLTTLQELLSGENGRPLITFSVGAALYDPERHRTVADLYEEADRLMYRQKSAG